MRKSPSSKLQRSPTPAYSARSRAIFEHTGGEIEPEDFVGALACERDAVVARPAADIDHAAAGGRLAAGDRLLITHQHGMTKQPVGDAFQRPVVVAVDRIEIDRITVEKLRRAVVHCTVLCDM